MKIFALLCEPADYTLDLIAHVYDVRGIAYAFVNNASVASAQEISGEERIVPRGLFGKLSFFCRILSRYDCLIINGYTGIDCLCLILLNMLSHRHPMTLESDTELRIPKQPLRRLVKWLWLHFLFTRKYVYGFAGGNYRHKDLFRFYGMMEDRIFLAPMVVDNEKYALAERKVDACIFNFGYVGRLVDIKQVDKIIAAIGLLVAKGHKVSLTVVGDGPERPRLERLATTLPVEFTGKVFGEAKIRILHGIDCLILYSSYEPWGLVVNEALASGIPVIVSDKVGACKDLVEGDEPTGLVAKWDDVNDLAKKMEVMLSDSEERGKKQANAISRMSVWNYELYGQNFDSWLKVVENEKVV